MQTNKTISKENKLYGIGNRFFEVANEYWEEYQKQLGSAALVWIENEKGTFILFTRGEYKESILSQAMKESFNKHLEYPFTVSDEESYAENSEPIQEQD